MAIEMDKPVKPRLPTTGLQSRQSYVSRQGRSAQPDLQRRNTLTRRDPMAIQDKAADPRAVSRQIGAYSPAERISREGMVRGPRQDQRISRTQFVGGAPGAVRVSYDRRPEPDARKFLETVEPTTDTRVEEVTPYGFQGQGLEARKQAEQYLANLRSIGQNFGPRAARQGFQRGGPVVDTVPAWLQPQEFVIDKANTNAIKNAEGAQLESALMALAGDIKSGRRPGDRPPGGRVNFAGGGNVTEDMQPGYYKGGKVKDKMQPGYELGGEVPPRKKVTTEERDPRWWEKAGQYFTGGIGVDKRTGMPTFEKVTQHYDASGRAIDPDVAIATQEGYDADYEYQQGQERQRQREAREQEAARLKQMQSFEQMREASQKRSGIAKERGADLQRRVGDIAAKSAQANTAQAARMALARTSIQPVESSLSTASQMQLRSSLQGGILRAQAEMQAQKMAIDAEMQEATDAINIAAQQLQLSSSQEQREFHLQRQREAQERQQYLAQRDALLRMKIAKAQEPSFWEAALPSLITGGLGLLGTVIGGPIGGAAGRLAGDAISTPATDYYEAAYTSSPGDYNSNPFLGRGLIDQEPGGFVPSWAE